MGWFTKPKEGDIYWTELPEEGQKLSGDRARPVIVNSNNKDQTSNVIGCSTKYKPELEDIEVKTKPGMKETTYARVKDGERLVDNYNLRRDKEKNRVTNLDEIREGLK